MGTEYGIEYFLFVSQALTWGTIVKNLLYDDNNIRLSSYSKKSDGMFFNIQNIFLE